MNSRSRGVALISVLLVMATAVTLLSWVISLQWLDLRRTTNLLESRQAHYYALGAETFARQQLAGDLRDNAVDHPGESWATPAEPLAIEDGALALTIDDLQGRFNINNLINRQGQLQSDELGRFRRLLTVLGLPQRYAAELQDWLDRDDRPIALGAEDAEYRERGTATAAGWITATAELRQLKSMRAEDFARLEPHISAIPGQTRININTATPAVLQAVLPALSASRAASLAARRSAGGWQSLEAFITAAGIAGNGLEGVLSVNSEYFQVTAEARYARQRATLTTTLRRQRGDRGVKLDVLSRQHHAQPLRTGENS